MSAYYQWLRVRPPRRVLRKGQSRRRAASRGRALPPVRYPAPRAAPGTPGGGEAQRARAAAAAGGLSAARYTPYQKAWRSRTRARPQHAPVIGVTRAVQPSESRDGARGTEGANRGKARAQLGGTPETEHRLPSLVVCVRRGSPGSSPRTSTTMMSE